MSRVVITQNDEIGRAISEALGHLEIKPLIRGKVVAVKPNETYASSSDTTGVTQPDTLRAVLQYLKKFQPKELIVSGGSGAAKTGEVFETVGLMQVVREEGVEFFDHNRPPFTEVRLEYVPEADVSGPQRSVMVNSRVLQYESLITLNQLKMHEMATVTLSLKNIAMSYPAADYYGYPRMSEKKEHAFFDDLHSFIAAMARRFPADLAITVGHPAMIGTGPLGGYTFETGLVIASPDALAADVVGAKILGFQPQAVRHLWEAGKMGLGEMDVFKMEFPAMNLKDAIGAFTERAFGRRLTYEHP
jgi:uncharacterized protein (DUF362 family)